MKIAILVALLGLSTAAMAADAPVTFAKDVAPIFNKACVECHRPTMFAPMSPPTFDEGWTIGKPDAIFTMDEEFTIPATGTIPYKYFRAPTGVTEDKWIQAIEIHPSARAQVHHVLA